jgi:ankyrin repeat protein
MACCLDLHNASRNGHINCLQTLIDQRQGFNHNVNETDLYGHTPLYHASTRGHIKCVDVLLGSGADIDTVFEGSLHRTIYYGHIDIVQMLIEAGVDINKRFNGYTPLHTAVYKENIDIIRLLLDYGADKNILDGFSRRASDTTSSVLIKQLIDDYEFFEVKEPDIN